MLHISQTCPGLSLRYVQCWQSHDASGLADRCAPAHHTAYSRLHRNFRVLIGVVIVKEKIDMERVQVPEPKQSHFPMQQHSLQDHA